MREVEGGIKICYAITQREWQFDYDSVIELTFKMPKYFRLRMWNWIRIGQDMEKIGTLK